MRKENFEKKYTRGKTRVGKSKRKRRKQKEGGGKLNEEKV